ncbi:transglutaminase-like putative cysteine protease [Paenibacillus castaneae]|uniref:DUF4129 domain-containing transglutaminase family protein n=1 Tax=Paenibacillus castaneae TaxID=474957 RepID=UPI000C9A2170|nr:transglutaminase domain-containing protein [Paenibacillus castaneae]NIK75218.1 transglutaminase-like putative cysteine protease [Paenibacillus castaneae]
MKHMLMKLIRYLSANWYEKLVFIFIGVILANMIAVFEGFWWKETYQIAYFTIFTAVAIDILLPLRSQFVKILLQIIASLFITIKFARMDWIISKVDRWQDWLWWLQVHAVQLHPFIWISAALLALYVLFGIWTTTRVRMFGLIGVSLVSLTVADSFTPIWLWDEVGMIVFIGLLWLAASHISKLQREHPSSFKELIEYPLQLILPVALVLTVLMSVGLSMPSLAPVLQDPYTMWKESKGERVQVFLGDKGSESQSSLNKGNASSGYSRSDEALGGGFDYDYSPMMTVSTSHRSYWRGETKAFYTGNGWINASGSDTPSTIVAVQKGVAFPIVEEPVAGTLQIDQIVTMIRKDVYPVLFAAAPVSKVNWIDNDEVAMRQDLIWEADSWELRLLNWSMKNKTYPEAYSLTSMVPVLDEDALRKSQAGWANKDEAADNSYYLQIPASMPARVKELAEQVTAEGTNDYDKARLLEQYLRLNFNYNNKPDTKKITGLTSDFVDTFLFELKEGYCDYFSTSMAIMARSLGMPARWVKGFAPGVLPASTYGPPGGFMEEDMNPKGAGTYTVRNSDAHSWVEIYFEGFGWIPFEATAGFSFPYSYAEEEKAALPDTVIEDGDESAAAANGRSFNSRLWAWSSASLLAVAAAAWLIVRRKQLIASWRRIRHGSYTPNDQIVFETQKLLRMCKKRGMERQEHETLREAVLRWSQSQKRLREDFRWVLDGFEQAKYSPMIVTAEDVDRFAAKVKSLIEELR